MLKSLLLIFILFVFSFCYANSQHNSLQKFINNEKHKLNLPGLCLTVLLPNQTSAITFTSGTKSTTDKTPLNSNSLFQIGSITKTFTAFLLAKEINSKHIKLNDKLGKFFPEYSRWKNITIEQLINQTSGIFDYIKSPGWWLKVYDHKKIWQAHELIDIAYKYPDNFTLGSAWNYSNTNYILLGMILEKITDKPLKISMQNIFDAIKLNHTYYLTSPYPQNIMRKMVHGYWQDAGKRVDTTAINGSWIQAAGAIVSTTADLTRWEKYFYNNIPFNLRDTKTGGNLTSLSGIGYSFGSFRMNTPEGLIWFTPGLTTGYTSMIAYAPCLDVYFSYSASLAPLDNFHKEMILGIMHELNRDQKLMKYLHKHVVLPDYCKKLKPAKKFEFPKLD